MGTVRSLCLSILVSICELVFERSRFRVRKRRAIRRSVRPPKRVERCVPLTSATFASYARAKTGVELSGDLRGNQKPCHEVPVSEIVGRRDTLNCAAIKDDQRRVPLPLRRILPAYGPKTLIERQAGHGVGFVFDGRTIQRVARRPTSSETGTS
ncbi:hypothetical protein EVAR_30896_1 [Eumeta japonica]|uniref:Secreted protein n=1 Tax=Eumeta variegata TaxID=151549 RepID=A0A4C1V3C6_EUMVA|nr:hypothetical protein EVAR_30896_1 [Eumeta japonica]